MELPQPGQAGRDRHFDAAQMFALARAWRVSTYRIFLAVDRVGPKFANVEKYQKDNPMRLRRW
jgi:hypothetical protein